MLARAAIVALGLVACVDQIDDAPTAITTVSIPPRFIEHPDAIAGRYIVVLDDQRKAIDIDRIASLHGATIERRYTNVLRGFSAHMTEDQARALASDPSVAYVEEDTPVYASVTQSNPVYGLDRIDQPSLPLNNAYNYTTDAMGVTVFVIDSGLNTTHVEFTGRVRADLGGTAIDDGNGVEDCNGHGTHVAGTVGGTTFGVAKKATIVPVRVLDCAGSGATTGVIAGMDFVANMHPPRSVVNMSLGGAVGEAKDAAVRNLVAKGVVVVVSAGNENTDACNASPAREPMAITVASSTNTDARSSFSNYGTCVDLFAPGSNITSAWIDGNTATDTISGTSMASPHVAGAAALYLAANPNATPAQVTAALLGSTAAGKISDVQGSPNKLLQTNFSAAPPPPPPQGAVMITSPASGAEVGAMFNVTVDSATATKVDLIVDGMLLVSDTTPPFSFVVSNAPAGMHRVAAAATNASGALGTHEITVTVSALGLGGGNNNPVPPPHRREDSGGCSTSGGNGLALIVVVLLVMMGRVRRPRSV